MPTFIECKPTTGGSLNMLSMVANQSTVEEDRIWAASEIERMETALVLDWTNNFLTVPCFAEHHGLSEAVALDMIERVRAKR